MNTITQADVLASGGVLAALLDKSAEATLRALGSNIRPTPSRVVDSLNRIIVHTDPHLDEYFAELLLRACLPREKWTCEFLEQSIYSATEDLTAKHLWPSSAVLGIGSTAADGILPLMLFDEHVAGQVRIAASCSQIVADKMLTDVPESIASVLREVNIIDEFGGAHQQNLSTLVKTLHDVRFWFGKDVDDDVEVRDVLSADWKRAIVDACLAAVIVCLAEGVDLIGDPAAKRASLSASLDNYVTHSVHSGHPRFDNAVHRVRSTYGDQARVFQEAVLRNRTHPILDSANQPIPQLLLLSRICFACEHCWGEKWRDLIATHFWEGEVQNQLNFYAVEEALAGLFADGKPRAVTPVGVFTRTVLPEILAEVRTPGPHLKTVKKQRRVWVLTVTPSAGVLRSHQAVTSYLNKNNDGCGVVLIRNSSAGTTAIFKGSAIPADYWERLVTEIVSKEGEADPTSDPMGCWHVIHDSQGGIAPFILNGNKSHQYVPRSVIDAQALSEVVRRTFYKHR